MSAFLKTPNTIDSPPNRPEHVFDLTSGPHPAHTTHVAVFLFICRYLRRADEDFQRYKTELPGILYWFCQGLGMVSTFLKTPNSLDSPKANGARL